MRYIITILLSLVFTTSIQADLTWVCWERYITITGQKAEINQRLAERVDGWEALGVFQKKARCMEYVMALSTYIGKDWERMAKTTGYEMASIMASATPVAYGRDTSTSRPKKQGIRGFILSS